MHRGRVAVDKWCSQDFSVPDFQHTFTEIYQKGRYKKQHPFFLSGNRVIEMKSVTTTNATVKIDQQFVSFETERSVQTASCLEAGSNLTTKN
jgi:hypothetical protein